MGWIRRVRELWFRDEREREFDEELRFHLAMREQRNLDEGMTPDDARRRARLRFGNAAVWRERMAEIDVMLFPQTMWQDVRFGARLLVRNLGFTTMAVVALAMGIGVNTAAFTAYKAFFARKLEARDADRMVNTALVLRSGAFQSFLSYPDYLTYRDQVHSFQGVIATSVPQFLTLLAQGGVADRRGQEQGTLLGRLGVLPNVGANDESAETLLVSENYFSVLGVGAVRGRVFDAGDTKELTASPAVLVSENYWRKRFNGDPGIVGKTVRLNGAAFTIMGVTPHNFVGTFVSAPDFWMPLALEPLVHPADNWLVNREDLRLHVRARLATGATMGEAQEEMSVVADHLRALHAPHADFAQPLRAVVWPGSPFALPVDQNRGVEISLLFVMAAVAMVLVVACANVASLQLARAASRHNELAMRLSLGASRGRLIRQLLTESALLALVAGGLAFLFSWALLQVVVVIAANAFPEQYGTFIFHVTPDLSVFAFVFFLSVLAGVLFGLAPAFESSRSAVSSALKASASTSLGGRRHLRSFLIAAQVALSAVLMIAGGLFIHGAIRALRMDTGYDDAHLLDLSLQLPESLAYKPEHKAELARELRDRVATMPGVVDVTTARAPDDEDFRDAAVSIDGENPSANNTKATLYYTWIQPDYFQTLRIPLLVGHGFTAGDAEEKAVILSESAANQLWPGNNPLGCTLRMSTDHKFHTTDEPLPDGPVWRVIGVARDTRGVLFDGSDSEQIYLPLSDPDLWRYPMLVRTRSAPADVANALGPVIAAVDPSMTVRSVTLEEMLLQTPPFIGSTLAAAVASATGLLGLILVSIGIYGTVSYIVVLRTKELGIRMALGARKADILGLILRDSTRPVLAGLVAGVTLAGGVAYLLRHVLYGIHVIDGLSFGGVSLLLLLIALLAAFVPSRRAMRVEPVIALRYE
jgi:macrolide transport system ATP-binding/permease protein